MPDDLDKSQREVEMFYEFIVRSGRSIDPSSVEKRHPPEPDILCRLNKSEFVAFELAEICDESLARTINELSKKDEPESEYIRTGSPVLQILNKKRDKKYDTHHPIELLVYVDGRVIDPPDQIISKINQVFSRPGNYRRVWFMGGEGEVCKCVIERLEPSNTV